MQLDQTHVVVRSRSIAEMGDLSFLLLQRYPQAIFIGFLPMAIILAAVNAVLLGPNLLIDFWNGTFDEIYQSTLSSFAYRMVCLVILQMPVVGVFSTYFIGQAVFEESPPWKEVFRTCAGLWWTCTWVLGILRGPLPLMILFAIYWRSDDPGISVFLNVTTGFWTGIVVIFRTLRPYMPEILLLERCPIRSSANAPMSAGKRSGNLHGPISGDLILRGMLVGLASGGLVVSLFVTLLFLRGVFFGSWAFDFYAIFLLMPLTLWTVACLNVFLRFLGYLDARIRLEGWEVELSLRAERIRQFGEDVSALGKVGPQ